MVTSFLFLALAKPQLTFDVRFREMANLTYELDSISGQLPWEANGRYKALWNREFLHEAEDEAMVEQWRVNRKALDVAHVPDSIQFPLENPYNELDQELWMRGAGFDAESPKDYVVRVAAYTTEEQAKSLGRVLEYFQPRFHKWWQSTAKKQGDPFAKGIAKLLTSRKISDQMNRVVNFYQADLGKSFRLPFDLMYKPIDGPNENSAGQQLGQYSVVQFMAGEKPEDRVDVVLHEVCHFLYGRMPADKHLQFQNGLVNSGRRSAVPCFNLLNESLATAFGNGMIAQSVQAKDKFQRRYERERGWYDNPGIDLAAKTIFAWLPKYIEKGKTLAAPEFTSLYLDSLEKTLGESLTAPSCYMTSLLLVYPPECDGWVVPLARSTFHTASMYAETSEFRRADSAQNYTSHSALGSVIVVKSGSVDRLVERGILNPVQLAAIRDRLQSEPSAMLALWGTRLAPTFVITADSRTDVEAWIQKIATLTEIQEGIQ